LRVGKAFYARAEFIAQGCSVGRKTFYTQWLTFISANASLARDT